MAVSKPTSTLNKMLIIDDDPLVRKSLQLLFRTEDYEVFTCESGKQGIQKLVELQPDVVLLDLKLGDMDGVDVLRHIKRKGGQAQVIMLTAHGSIENTVQAMREGAFDYVQKPYDTRRLKETVRKGIEFKRGREGATGDQDSGVFLKDGPITMVMKSPKSIRVHEIIRRMAASSDSTVLIEGESGTGKELAASSLHLLSCRRDMPFVSLNCACIPEHLAESELFGYEKGAFTDSLKEGKAGKFQLAEGGTLFLDEIGDLSLGVQTKILRILENKTFFRIGGTKEIRCNVRVVAATNKSLLNEVRNGRFREDLYYRLSALKIVLPPLRERREDIVPLAHYFLTAFSARNDLPLMKISREAETMLESLPWKGNVRELRNAMERVMLLESGGVLYPEHLEFLREEEQFSSEAGDRPCYSRADEKSTYDDMLEKMLREALSKAEGNQTKAAQLLGISRSKLRYQISKYAVKE